jgi:hypothetical protein
MEILFLCPVVPVNHDKVLRCEVRKGIAFFPNIYKTASPWKGGMKERKPPAIIESEGYIIPDFGSNHSTDNGPEEEERSTITLPPS